MKNPLREARLAIRAWRGHIHNERARRGPAPEQRRRITDAFHRLYYDGHRSGTTWGDTWWLGVRTEKCPLDLWIYQEMIFTLRPDVIVETGTRFGGSALFLASMCDLVGNGSVVSVDIEAMADRPVHPRIEYLTGSSVAPDIVRAVQQRIPSGARVLVVLDSDHSADHVRLELEAYAPLVTRGSYLIVEDTNLGGNPIGADFGPGPMAAVKEFLARHAEFCADPAKEKFLLTFSPGGYLRRT